ncbi:RNA polymerase I-specific transcription initiation factor RRN3-like [Adelges cooleyi]|uniref:RNA polymerase I-specific transcription initiation factor RRN3-like n=1 Tax=Adelges cooleyi TaxID=133065 RepID=UPI00217F2D27|nr:RNA polymerase I-specific transcription initiation factor RRN3-like [Adelges cooleyi]
MSSYHSHKSGMQNGAGSPSILKKRGVLSQNNVPKRSVHFSLFNNLKSMLVQFDQNNVKDKIQYNNLICDIRDTGVEIKDFELVKILKDARNCVNILNENLTLFVKVILVLKWMNRSDEVINEYRGFLLEVCCAHNYHTKFAVEQLVSCFSEVNTQEVNRVDGMPSEYEEKCYRNVHDTLSELLRIIPLAKDILLAALQKKFPYKRNNTEACLHYIHNLFTILDYEPSLRKNILSLVINRLVEIDAHVPREELDRLRNRTSPEPEDIFAMDIDGDDVETNPDRLESEYFSRSLDICMLRIFKFLKSSCHDKSGVLIWDSARLLFQDLLAVFESEILPTYASSHIQYVIYYFVSFKPALAEKFSIYLWKKCCDVTAPSTLRQAAAGYLASFLSRAPFVSINVLKTILAELTTWCDDYIDRVDKSIKVVNEELLRWHAVFYSICQALFYVIAFRHEDLMGSKRNLKFMENLNLSKIVTSRLSPLRICCSKVASRFAHITKTYQLTYCYTVMDGHVDITDRSIKEEWLYSFFPFEPYVLPISKSTVVPNLYREIGVDINHGLPIDDGQEHECMDISPSMLSSSSPTQTDWLGRLADRDDLC